MALTAELLRRATPLQSIVHDAAGKYGLPASLLNGLITQESRWVPTATRLEPHLPKVNGETDGSVGLVQVLFSTARAMGYRGKRNGLADPRTNIELGARFLADQIKLAKGDISAALSRYNGGYRPSVALGARATKPTRGVSARNPDGTVKSYRIVPVGQFLNQAYVDAVLGYANGFKSAERSLATAPKISPGALISDLEAAPDAAPLVRAVTSAEWTRGAIVLGVTVLLGVTLVTLARRRVVA